MKRITIDRPNPKQERCMRSKKRYVIFGGARGGGAELTAQGAELLARYRAFETEAQAALAALAERHFEGMEGAE